MDTINSPAFAAHVEALLQQHHTPGVSIAVAHNDRFASAGFGKANLTPGKEQDCTADTLYDIASCSKSLTAAAVALLVEDEEKFPRVTWKSKMSDLLPDDFVMERESYTNDVTVEDILSHRTGLPR